MTDQEVFDKVVAHARQQGGKAVNEDGRVCMYRDGLGNKCFAGIFIPDEDYKPGMEGNPIRSLVIDYNLFSQVDTNLLFELQTIHDYTTATGWETRFKKLAEKRGLVYKEPT